MDPKLQTPLPDRRTALAAAASLAIVRALVLAAASRTQAWDLFSPRPAPGAAPDMRPEQRLARAA